MPKPIAIIDATMFPVVRVESRWNQVKVPLRAYCTLDLSNVTTDGSYLFYFIDEEESIDEETSSKFGNALLSFHRSICGHRRDYKAKGFID